MILETGFLRAAEGLGPAISVVPSADTTGTRAASGLRQARVTGVSAGPPHAGGMTSNDLVIEAEGLVKRFGTTKALRDGRASLFGEGSLRTPGSPAPRRPNASECR